MNDVHVKILHTMAEFNEFVELQKIVWRLKDYGDCIPNHVMLAVRESGGIVLGAYHKGEMVGFTLILSAYSKKEGYYHHSHIMGIHPEWQNKGIGYVLKKEHYQKAISLGVKKVTWTYDPLLGSNANLNISKLGGIVRKYKIDVYGEFMGGSDLVSGIPSDRFWLEWYIDTNRVTERMKSGYKSANRQPQLKIEPVNLLNKTSGNLQQMRSFAMDKNAARIFIEIPSNFQAIYDSRKDLAVDWRLKSREMFTAYFQSGFIVADFFRVSSSEGYRNFYMLEKNFKLN
ncbi:hypothetical protein AMJ80_08890 [bacterium SM23_31]|nr:MAG: hypothetical protein AMJ80_08890 [bacterium SM23_31]